MKDLSARWNAILVVLALATMLGCQALEANKGANRQQQSGSLVLNSATLDFGGVVLGNSKTLAVTLVNSTSSDVTVTGAIITGSDYSLTSPSLPTTIAGGKSGTLTLGFTPHVFGKIAGTVAISSDASGPPLTLALSGAGTPAGQLTASPSSLDFGNLMVGNSVTKTETLTNSGGSDLSVTQVLVSGSDFQVSGLSLPLTLASNQSVVFSVTFTPISNGSRSATLSITSDDFVGSRGRHRRSFKGNDVVTLTIPLSGNGVMPGQLAATPASLSFGSVQVGSDQTLSETLTNSGSTTVTVSQATPTGGGFSISGLALPLTMLAGQSATFSVKFAPQAAGAVSGNVAIVSDASNSPLNVPLTGTGIAAGSLTAAPSSLSFGNVQTGKNQTLSETLTNSGGSTVTITQATVTGAGFSLSGLSLPVTLTAGQSKAFSVVFAPQSAGAVTGNIAVISDASNSTLNVPLSGTGVAAGLLTANPTSLSFGSVQVGSNQTLSETVTNSGGSTVTITQANVTGAGFTLSGLSLPVTLTAGQSKAFSVVFAPQSAGAVTGNIAVISDASNSTLNVPLSGTGVAAGLLTANPTSLSFGSVQVGSNQTLSETVTNSGGSTVTITQANVTGAGFTLSGLSLPVTLTAGQSKAFNVVFTPQSAGAVTGNIAVISNASNSTLNIPLSGTGVTPGLLAANPTSLSFGSVQVGSNQTLSETVTNSGGSTVTITQANVTGAGFTLSGLSLPVTLTAGQSKAFSVVFTPQSAGAVTGNIAVISNASNSTLNIPLSGTGVSPGSLTANPSSISFGNVQVGNNQTLSETVTNSGGSTVTITQANVTGAGFTLSGLSLPVTLTAGQSKAFSVVFTPQSAGAVTGNIAVISNASNSTLNIPLSGTGVSPGSLTANPSSISFGNVQVGNNQTLSETLTNSGGSTVTITQATVTGSGYSLSGLTLPVTLTAGQSKTFSVVFAPQSAGAVTGNIAVISDASNSTLNVPLSGTGVTPGSLAANPISLSFGSVQVGSNQTLSETVTNSGGSTITITQANVTGAGFSLSGLSLPVTLTAGQSKAFSVVFAPQSAGAVTGNIAVISDASNSTLNIPLSGTGVAAGLLTANPTSLSFGSVQVGSNQTLSETVTNSGGSTVTITQANVTGSGFTLTGLSLPVTLTAGQSKAFSVIFAPQSAGAVTGNIAVISDASNSTLNIPLSGTGVAAGLLTANPTSLSFGNVQVGNSQTLSETLTNTGGSTVTITQANVTGAGFTLSGLTLPVTLTAGQSKTFSAVFAPQSAGAVTGNIAVISNASNSTLNIPLSGTGVTAGFIAANPSSLSFGSVQVGSNKTLSETLTNSGGITATITQANVTGSGFSISGLSLPLTLSPGQSFTFGAVFTPTGAGSASGSISVVSDASNSPLSISMSGTGTAAGQLAVTPTTLDFGSVVVGSSKNLTGTLSATGASVTVSSVSVTSSEFVVSGISFPVTIAAGLSTSFTVTFTPQASGVASASATFISNASNSPTVESLTGTGTPPQQHSVDLSWDSSNSNDVVGYNIYRGTKSGTYTKINSGLNADLTYTDSTVQSGQTYYYASTAVDSGGKESTYSNEVQAVIPTP